MAKRKPMNSDSWKHRVGDCLAPSKESTGTPSPDWGCGLFTAWVLRCTSPSPVPGALHAIWAGEFYHGDTDSVRNLRQLCS